MLKFILVFVCYYVTAKFGLKLDSGNGFTTLVWAPSGIALAAILLMSWRIWPAIALAAFLVSLEMGAYLKIALIIAAGNTIEGLAAAALLKKFHFQNQLARVRDVFSLCFVSLFCPLISATMGVTSLWVANIISPENFFSSWREWWAGDAFGLAIVVPLILTWSQLKFKNFKFTTSRAVEFSLFLLVSLIVYFFVFEKPTLQIFWFFPLIVWVALRSTQVGTATAVFVLTAVAIGEAARGVGPFSAYIFRDNLYLLNSFLAITTLTGMVLAASITEKNQAVQLRDDFISIASHELKTPLSSLKLQMQMSKRKKQIDLGKFLFNNEVQVDRLIQLVEELLDVNHLQSGKFKFELKKANLSEIVRDSVTRFSEDLSAAQCPVDISIQDNVFGVFDAYRLEQVIDNLLTNIIKYAPNKAAKMQLTADSSNAVLTIEDSGPGIPLELQPTIFDRYNRGIRNNYTDGLGLGLYIVKELVTAHRGSIRLYSDGKSGSKFIIILPLA